MKMRTTRFLLTVASLVLLYCGAVQADQVTGKLWKVSEGLAQNATVANVNTQLGLKPSGDVSFTTDSTLDFNVGPGSTVAQFLASDMGLGNIVQHTPSTLASIMDNGIIGTLVQFTGSGIATTGQLFGFLHDDGITLTINGLPVIVDPGPTPPVIDMGTYTGSSGDNLSYQLVYGECCEGPAVLNGALLSQVPEPSTFLLFATGLGILGYGWRRRKQQA